MTNITMQRAPVGAYKAKKNCVDIREINYLGFSTLAAPDGVL